MQQSGRLIAASLGPGDPGLITRAAWQALEQASCWAWPVGRRDGESYALAIVQRTGLPQPARLLPLDFPMTRDPVALARYWHAAAIQTLAVLQEGVDVVFLIEGDASFFATFGYLSQTVRTLDPTIRVTVIPGVASPLAAAALEGEPLCAGEGSLAILPGSTDLERIGRFLDEFQTVVLLKVRPVLPALLDLLTRRNLLKHAVFVERAGAPEERVVRNVAELRDQPVHYLSLLIVHVDRSRS
ncbi:MAG: precorrin-2 C(20)-methyltransferase [Magnetococcales bacterium]|nr:precorrin-2 C(20)-methyltransferase [Magnetococcales bacterium]